MTEQERQAFTDAYRYYERYEHIQTDTEWEKAADEMAILYEGNKSVLAKKLLMAVYESIGGNKNSKRRIQHGLHDSDAGDA